MSNSPTDDFFDSDPLLSEIRLEFCDGLPERVDAIRSALKTLGRGTDPDAVECFFRAAHTLKGTAPSFGAHGLVGPATALAEAGRSWSSGATVSQEELTTALQQLERLSEEVARYTAQVKNEKSDEG